MILTQEIEIEYKNLLTKTEFKHLKSQLDFPELPRVQTNYYFETDQFELKGKRSALRIRETQQTYTLTLKEPHPDGLLETHDRLNVDEAHEWLNGHISFHPHTGKQLNSMNIASEALSLFGQLTTKRWETRYKGVLVVLDHSHYSDVEDFELEVEGPTQEAVSTVFNELLSEHNIPIRKTPNKIERLFTELSQ
ncbi:CYTH domain-containing protein [Lentibacillus saliphilus]|uniref:CYTH domain-containing protein n=1 Tax=Lentibacillus saliphilus TaxID=2737028 RepID=UPI001FE3B97F|nr:CYTH domain-containing protein [Lentibacillus saliphilus]